MVFGFSVFIFTSKYSFKIRIMTVESFRMSNDYSEELLDWQNENDAEQP